MNKKMDLIPNKTRTSRSMAKRLIGWVMVSVFVLAGVSLMGAYMQREIFRLDARVAPIRDQVSALEEWDNSLAPLADRLSTAFGRQLVVNELLNEPFWSGLLADLSFAARETLWLDRFTLTNEEVATPEGTTHEVTMMVISGVAVSDRELMRFMTRFSKSKHLASLSLEQATIPTNAKLHDMREFELQGAVQWRSE